MHGKLLNLKKIFYKIFNEFLNPEICKLGKISKIINAD